MGVKDIFELAMCTVFPVLAAVIMVYLSRDLKVTPGFKVFVGIVMGICAVFGTEVGFRFSDTAIINTRDAAVISAGFFFGFPSGAIAGLIGGVERLLATYVWHSATETTALACAVATSVAGCISGAVGSICLKDKASANGKTGGFSSLCYRDKTPTLLFGVIYTAITECVHCALALLFRLDIFNELFEVIKGLIVPQILANVVAVALAILAIRWIRGRQPKEA